MYELPFALTGDLAADVTRYLTHYGCQGTAGHVARVAKAARRLALATGLDPGAAETAAWLHDISTVIPGGERLAEALDWSIDVLPDERAYPPILHQKLSVNMARDLFGVTDPAILSAIGCHTTLKAGASPLDKLLFVADKLAWDGADSAPFREELEAAIANSLDHAAICYLAWLHGQRANLRVVHPWLRAAFHDLTGNNWED